MEVPADELEGRVTRKANELGRDLKLPGFRRGKVPAGLVIQRIGRDAVLEQAVRETLPRWYSDAIEASGIVPVGDPQVSLDEGLVRTVDWIKRNLERYRPGTYTV